MKLMKHITIALVLCAIPAVAVGQTVSCDDCSHVLSVYYGSGGLIAETDGDSVTYVASCEGVTRSGELMPNDDGMVSMLLSDDNGLACHGDDEDNSFEIGPVMDGGWYWLTMETNSAVGGLVSMDILDNDTVDIADAGDGVTMMMGSGAVLLTETATGRTGLLPNILPEAPMAALRKCGFDDRGTRGTSATSTADQADARFVRRTSDCALGDGGTITLATTTNSFTGATTMVADKSTVVRPSGTGEVVITIDLWGNQSGFFTTSATGHALLGQPAVALTALRGYRLAGVTYTASLGSGPTADDFVSGTALGGITMNTDTTDLVTFTIAADTAYCSDDNDIPAAVSVSAVITAEGAAATTPARSRHATTGVAGGTSFTVVCGSGSSANMGQELVPENPFPTE
ncbi:MAG: hypothetical protein OXG81_00520 [Acidobacteria bacterium]|nr:hypothetical protein [Acidobacteriota bacterium]